MRSGGLNSTESAATSRLETLGLGAIPLVVLVGTCGSEVGVGWLAETWQQELFPGAS